MCGLVVPGRDETMLVLLGAWESIDTDADLVIDSAVATLALWTVSMWVVMCRHVFYIM